MKSKQAIIAAIAAALLGGCASDNASYVESGGPRSIISANKIDVADWNAAAASLTNDLLSSGVLERTGEKQPIKLLVSRVKNSTSEVVDVEMLTRKITMTLINSGKAIVASGDIATQELAEAEAAANGSKVEKPKITITGKILENREINSSMKEVTYTFMLDVNYRGSAIWSGEKQITKQAEKPLFGW